MQMQLMRLAMYLNKLKIDQFVVIVLIESKFISAKLFLDIMKVHGVNY